MRYSRDACGNVFVDHGLGGRPLGIAMNQAAINQAAVKIVSEGTEIVTPTCPTGSTPRQAGAAIATCAVGWQRGATTVLANGVQCVPPCVPVTSSEETAAPTDKENAQNACAQAGGEWLDSSDGTHSSCTSSLPYSNMQTTTRYQFGPDGDSESTPYTRTYSKY